MKFLGTITRFVRAIPSAAIKTLDWLVAVAERLIVLGVAGLAFYFGYRFCFGLLSANESKRLDFLAQDWKIFVILLIPLFYKTVRTFLEEVQVAWGMSREKTSLPKEQPGPQPGSVPDIQASAAPITTEEV